MKITTIDLSKVNDGNPFTNVVWKNPTPEEESMIYGVLSKLNRDGS